MAQPRNRRARSNSFRGAGMHERLVGPTEVVIPQPPKPKETSNSVDCNGVPLQRKDSGRPVGRHWSTLTVKQNILRRKQELFGSQEYFEMPDADDLRFLCDQVALLDNDPAMFAARQNMLRGSSQLVLQDESDVSQRLERAVFTVYLYCDAKEKRHEPLTTTEFQMKAVVDDIIVRILLKDSIDATTGQIVTSPRPGTPSPLYRPIIPLPPIPPTSTLTPPHLVNSALLGAAGSAPTVASPLTKTPSGPAIKAFENPTRPQVDTACSQSMSG
eukprot:CFRG0850T1